MMLTCQELLAYTHRWLSCTGRHNSLHRACALTIGGVDVRHQSEKGDANMRVIGSDPALWAPPEATRAAVVALVAEAVTTA